jgi:membrane protein YdbS with pleckstrin-like domain
MVAFLANGMWILGCAGLLATAGYLDWQRSFQQRSWSQVWSTPRFLFPVSLSLVLVCAGCAWNGRVAVHPATWWVTGVWVALALLFVVFSVNSFMAGDKRGWDITMEGKHRL